MKTLSGLRIVRPKHLTTSQSFLSMSKLSVPRSTLSEGTVKSTLTKASNRTSFPAQAESTRPDFLMTTRGGMPSEKL